eukprot:TRINITY_DN15225_c0_g1_i2.p1 TRINITY_DN15225_c0_g1~~TRINITY_DN15225_c0_g1_i2.p1  ORF type:complete len:593 (+),score=112.07 TRINITY_DN15225_c0_g1_i2:527-2305(+)
MIEEYGEPMVLDQATISNTNHIGHPPHADNVKFDSVWWEGKQIRKEDELKAAREGAYVLWRTEKTSYRSYTCTVGLSDPNGYEGGEVQLFDKWGDKEPAARYKCAPGTGVAFCGCSKNIHAVTGVKRGFRLVFLVWTRPPDVRVPENQAHVCYFRPGTGFGCWLTTADIQKHQARKRRRDSSTEPLGYWVPKEEEDNDCQCEKCFAERQKVAWKDCQDANFSPGCSSRETPTTSAGNSPRDAGDHSSSKGSDTDGKSPECQDKPSHCPQPQGAILCKSHNRVELNGVLSKADIKRLQHIWEKNQDDLSHPWYDEKPTFSDEEFTDFRAIAQKVVDAMSAAWNEPLVLDQATVSNTNHLGHPPHADNVQFSSVWWQGRQIKQCDELKAAREGAEVLWTQTRTNYRNYSASVALSDPSQYGGGYLEFFSRWGQKEADVKYRCRPGHGMAFCGCPKNVHAVTGVKWGFRLVLLVWTRPPDSIVPKDQAHVCYFRPGTGSSIWLTSADLEHYPKRRQKRGTWVPIVNSDNQDEDAEEEKVVEEEEEGDEEWEAGWEGAEEEDDSTSDGESSQKSKKESEDWREWRDWQWKRGWWNH